MANYIASSNYPSQYPIELFFGLLRYGSGFTALPKDIHSHGEWGKPLSTFIIGEKERPAPEKIDIVWLSLIESTFYSVEKDLPTERFEQLFAMKDEKSGKDIYERVIVGMAPYGGVAVWTYGFKKSVLVCWMHGEKTQVDMKDFQPMNPTSDLDKYCRSNISFDPLVRNNLEKNGLPPRDLYVNYMKQFTYRYLPLFEHWNEDEEKWQPYSEEEQKTKPEFDYIEEALYDGTHDKLHDGSLLNYHDAGKPKKLAVTWHIKKSEYTAYFWFDDEAIRAIFDKFYGIHPDTKTDFVIHIDPERKKYELALYRYGMNEPKPISEDAYQLIVFKNKFEQYRSRNYNQPRGAWIW